MTWRVFLHPHPRPLPARGRGDPPRTLKHCFSACAARVKPGGTLWIVFIGHGAPSRGGDDGVLVGWDAQQDADSLYARSLPKKALLGLVAGGEMTAGVTMHLAECCSPLPGDRIIGVLIPERGIEVHVIDCARLADYEGQADHWLDLRWKPKGDADAPLAVGRIHVTTANRRGALALLAKTVSDAQGNIINVKTLKRSPDFFDFAFDVEVEDNKRLTQIVAALRALAVVDSAERVKG